MGYFKRNFWSMALLFASIYFIFSFKRKSALFERMRIVQTTKTINRKMKGGTWWIQHGWNQHRAHPGMTATLCSSNRLSPFKSNIQWRCVNFINKYYANLVCVHCSIKSTTLCWKLNTKDNSQMDFIRMLRRDWNSENPTYLGDFRGKWRDKGNHFTLITFTMFAFKVLIHIKIRAPHNGRLIHLVISIWNEQSVEGSETCHRRCQRWYSKAHWLPTNTPHIFTVK